MGLANKMLEEVEDNKPMPVVKSCFKVTSQTIGYSFFSRDMNQYVVNGEKLVTALRNAINDALLASFTFGFLLRKVLIPLPTTKWGVLLTK